MRWPTTSPRLTISKIRFLETEGLISPSAPAPATGSSRRADVDRLRYVLRMQRDHYLPLKVIREHLDAIDRGLDPAGRPGPRCPTPSVDPRPARTPTRSSRAARCGSARVSSPRPPGSTRRTSPPLVEHGLLRPHPDGSFRADDLRAARRPPSSRGTGSSRATCASSTPPPTASRDCSSRRTASLRGTDAAQARERRAAPGPGAARGPRAAGAARRASPEPSGYGGDVKVLDVIGVRVEMPSNQPIVLLREVTETATCRSGSAPSRPPPSPSPSRVSCRRGR